MPRAQTILNEFTPEGAVNFMKVCHSVGEGDSRCMQRALINLTTIKSAEMVCVNPGEDVQTYTLKITYKDGKKRVFKGLSAADAHEIEYNYFGILDDKGIKNRFSVKRDDEYSEIVTVIADKPLNTVAGFIEFLKTYFNSESIELISTEDTRDKLWDYIRTASDALRAGANKEPEPGPVKKSRKKKKECDHIIGSFRHTADTIDGIKLDIELSIECDWEDKDTAKEGFFAGFIPYLFCPLCGEPLEIDPKEFFEEAYEGYLTSDRYRLKHSRR